MRNLTSNLHPVMAKALAPFVYQAQFSLGIDVQTKDTLELCERLKALPGTISVKFGGVYREGPEFSQVHVVTRLTEAQLDDWLYVNCGDVEWVGVFPLEVTA